MADLAGVLLGGALTLIGSATTQWYMHSIKTREERRTRRAQKFEELVSGVHEHGHWLDEHRRARVFGTLPDILSMSPLSRVEAISTIYFPEFDKLILDVYTAGSEYEQWMTSEEIKRLQTKPL